MGTVIFDLDGTLADTSGDLIAAANACFADLGLGALLDPQKDAEIAFHGGKAMLTEGLQRSYGRPVNGEWRNHFDKFIGYYRDSIDLHTTLYPGAIAAVERLKAAGYRVGICTNKPEDLAETLLHRLGVREVFASMIGADTMEHRKPHPAPYEAAVLRAGGDISRSLIVGDTVTDRDVARAAGVPAILVTFGPAGRRVAEHDPEGLIGHFDELQDEVARLLPLRKLH